MRHLLMAHQQESFLPFSSWQGLSCCLSRVAKRSTPKPSGPLYSPSEPRGPFPHFRTTWTSIYLLASEPRGSTLSFRAAWSPPHLLWSRVVSSFLPQNLVVLSLLWLPCLGLNPSTHLPLQPISDSSYSQLHLPASPYSSSFTGLP